MKHDFVIVGKEATCKRCGYRQYSAIPAPDNCPGDLIDQRKAERRERIAAAAMAGLIACNTDDDTDSIIAASLRYADRMIAELDKPKESHDAP